MKVKVKIFAFVADNPRNYYLPQRLFESFEEDFAGWFKYTSLSQKKRQPRIAFFRHFRNCLSPDIRKSARSILYYLRFVSSRIGRKIALKAYLHKISLAERKLSSFLSFNKLESSFLGTIDSWSNLETELGSYLGSETKNILVVSGGPIIPASILNRFDFAVNQHAGVAPRYKGSLTVEQALFRRDLNHVGSTVHFMNSRVDSGDIILTRNVNFHRHHTAADIFVRTVLLGSELIVEALDIFFREGAFTVAKVQTEVGNTFQAEDFSLGIFLELRSRKFARWMNKQIQSRRNG